jgi:putative membrane protein
MTEPMARANPAPLASAAAPAARAPAPLPAPALAFALAWLAPALALAHPGEAHPNATPPFWQGWQAWDPLALAAIALPAGVYALGLRRLWRKAGPGRGVRRWEVLAYASGIAALAVALVSPLDPLSDVLFSAHMSQHEILMLVAAPLLVLGRPSLPALFALPPGPRERAARLAQSPAALAAWRRATGPLFVLVVHAAMLWVWHAPALFEAALKSEAVHALQHALFFVTAALFWWALARGRYGRAGYGVAVLYVFATALHSSVLGALITVTGRLLYPTHAGRTRAFGLDPLEDQQLAGLIMWVPTGIIFVVLGLAFFAAWVGYSERRAARSSHEALRGGRAIEAGGDAAPGAGVGPA